MIWWEPVLTQDHRGEWGWAVHPPQDRPGLPQNCARAVLIPGGMWEHPPLWALGVLRNPRAHEVFFSTSWGFLLVLQVGGHQHLSCNFAFSSFAGVGMIYPFWTKQYSLCDLNTGLVYFLIDGDTFLPAPQEVAGNTYLLPETTLKTVVVFSKAAWLPNTSRR